VNPHVQFAGLRECIASTTTQGDICLVTEFGRKALNGLLCAVLQPLDLVPLTDFTYKLTTPWH